jgi:hypothetical protein
VVARGRAFNVVQGTPARLRDLVVLFAILREIGLTVVAVGRIYRHIIAA